MKNIILITILYITFCSNLLAAGKSFSFINPSFGGNQFNSAHLLGSADRQKPIPKQPQIEETSDAEFFKEQLTRRALSALTSNIIQQITSNSGAETGQYDLDGLIINYEKNEAEGVVKLTVQDQLQIIELELPIFDNDN